MELPIKFDFQLTVEDYKQSIKVFAAKAKNLRPQYIVAALLFLYTLWILFTGGTTSIFFAVMGIAFFPIVLLLQFVIGPIQMGRKAEQSPPLTVSQQWVVDENGIEVISEMGTATYQWEEFRSVLEDANYVLLQYKSNPNALIFVPVRAFTSAEQEKAFVELAKEQVGERQKKK